MIEMAQPEQRDFSSFIGPIGYLNQLVTMAERNEHERRLKANVQSPWSAAMRAKILQEIDTTSQLARCVTESQALYAEMEGCEIDPVAGGGDIEPPYS